MEQCLRLYLDFTVLTKKGTSSFPHMVEPLGSTATIKHPGQRRFSPCASPEAVPPVPVPMTAMSTWPNASNISVVVCSK